MRRDAAAETELHSESATDKVGRVEPAGGGADFPVVDNDRDFFVEKDGMRFAGIHLLIEMWGAGNLDDPGAIEQVLNAAAAASGATVLHGHLHHFSPSGGVSGIVVLAESHISIHTWPERQFAAIDLFMCGVCDPYLAVPTLREFFAPSAVQMTEQKRGLLP